MIGVRNSLEEIILWFFFLLHNIFNSHMFIFFLVYLGTSDKRQPECVVLPMFIGVINAALYHKMFRLKNRFFYVISFRILPDNSLSLPSTWHKDKICVFSPQMFPLTPSFTNKCTWEHLLFLGNGLLGATHTNLFGWGGPIKSQLSLLLQYTCFLCQEIKLHRFNLIYDTRDPEMWNSRYVLR